MSLVRNGKLLLKRKAVQTTTTKSEDSSLKDESPKLPHTTEITGGDDTSLLVASRPSKGEAFPQVEREQLEDWNTFADTVIAKSFSELTFEEFEKFERVTGEAKSLVESLEESK